MPTFTDTAARSRPRWVSGLLWLGLAACAAVLAVSFLWPQPRHEKVGDVPEIRTVSLPNVEAPASRFDADMALLSDRDFDLLLEPQDEAVYRDLDFYAWYAVQAAAPAATSATPSTPPPAQDVSEEPETSDATL